MQRPRSAVPRRADRQPARPPAVHEAGRQRRRGHLPASCGPSRTRRSPPRSPRSRRSACAASTDGEFRRAWFHLDFLEQLDGVAVTGNIAGELRRRLDRPHDAPEAVRRSARCAMPDHPGRRLPLPRLGRDRTPKVSIPSPHDGPLPWRPSRPSTSTPTPTSSSSSTTCRPATRRARRPVRRRVPYVQLDDATLLPLRPGDAGRPAARRRPRRPPRPPTPS